MDHEQSCAPEKNKTRTFPLDRCSRIRALNDQLRQNLSGGRIMITPGVSELGSIAVADVVGLVRAFDAFSAGNDPYHEHDFGSVTWESQTPFWKIDYYDGKLEFGSPDPADPAVTTRVLTVMLASEY